MSAGIFKKRNVLKRALLAGAAIVVMAHPAAAFEWEHGDITGSIDTTLSAGMSFRVADRDMSNIGIGSGGTSRSANGDDGNLNYDRGVVAETLKATHEAEVNLGDHGGAFVRVTYFYDFKNADGDTDYRDLTGPARLAVGRDFKLLEASLWTEFDVAGHPLHLDGGNEVLNWGESTFIPNGINAINPIDVSAIRVPGSEVRDALVPVPLVHADLGISDRLNLEGFYQFGWEKTTPDAAGTFFSTNDFASPGGKYVMLGFGAVPIPSLGLTEEVLLGMTPGALTGTLGASAALGVVVPRGPDADPKNGGQFGVAGHYFSDLLGGTEFGLFGMNLHSRLPVVSGLSGDFNDLDGPGGGGPLAGGDANFAAGSRYLVEYPEDIPLFGASFSTQLGTTGIALQGEYSFRHDQPLQVDDVEVLAATMAPAILANPGTFNCVLAPGGGACATGVATLNANQVIAQRGGIASGADVAGLFGQRVQGWVERDVSQAQMTATKLLGPHIGADSIALVGELGGTYIHDMPDESVLRLEAPGTPLGGNAATMALFGLPAQGGFADQFSAGYQIRARFDYLNAMGPVNVVPGVAWRHDFMGTTPSPLGTFIEGQKAVTLSLDFENLEPLINTPWNTDDLTFSVQYTNFFGGGEANQVSDRDFVSAVLKYSF
jgi:hypothetical protein